MDDIKRLSDTEHWAEFYACRVKDNREVIKGLYDCINSIEVENEKLEQLIKEQLKGSTLKTPKVDISYKKGMLITVTDIAKVPEEYTEATVDIDVTNDKVKDAIAKGESIPGLDIVKSEYLVIK